MLKYSKIDDIKELTHKEWGVSIENLLGHWRNTNEKTGHIAKVEITHEGQSFFMQAFGVDVEDGKFIQWKKVKCEVFSSHINSKEVGGLNATVDMGFMEISMAALIKYGILVIQTYNTFKDESGRSNYFLREFFRQ